METIMKCIENNGVSFILMGKAPKNTFIKSQLIFQKVFNSFEFEQK